MCAFERLCDKLSSECENEMYALHQLHDMMCADMDDNSDVYGREYRKAAIPNLLHRATPKIFHEERRPHLLKYLKKYE